MGEQERLKDKPKKEAIISNKIREVEDTIQLLAERHLDSMDDDYPNFETAKSELLVDLDLNKARGGGDAIFPRGTSYICYWQKCWK
ncbi:TPA: hypothetical protein ACTXXA_002165 [Legionella anisa]